jgi:hypothetical protein
VKSNIVVHNKDGDQRARARLKREDTYMEINGDHPDLANITSKTETFNLSNLVSIIGYKLTAYISGATTTQSVVGWLQSGLPEDLEPRMRVAFDVAAPIAEVESELIAQGFLTEQREEISYGTPARMLREAGIETARSVLMRVAAAEFLSNEAPNLDDIEVRLQDWIKHAELPERVGYKCQMWQNRLSLTLIHTNFTDEVQGKWDRGIDWPCWNQITVVVPEMARARCEINLTTGFPFRYLRSQFMRPTREE